MCIAESKELFKRLKADKQFSNKVITAGSMMERMEIILSCGFDCTKDELQMVLEKYTEEVSSFGCSHDALC